MAALRLPLPAAVLLDLDGTLVDSEPAHRAAWFALFDSRGWHVDEETYLRHFVGRRGTDVLSTLPGPWDRRDAEALTNEVIGYLPDFLEHATAMSGALDLLRELRTRSVPTAVVTSAADEWATQALTDVLGAEDLIGTVVSADDVTRGKPDPEGYVLACERLSVDARDAVAFEDSTAGVRAAVAAGVGMVVGVGSAAAVSALRGAGAQHVVADLTEVTLVTDR